MFSIIRFLFAVLLLCGLGSFCFAYDDWDATPEPEVKIEPDNKPDERTADDLLEQLRAARNARDRIEAVEECKKRPESLPKFLTLLDDKDYRMRRIAIELFMHFRAPDALDRLNKLYVSDPDRPVRETCRDNLVRFGDKVAEMFVKNLVNENPDAKRKQEYIDDAKLVLPYLSTKAAFAVDAAFKGKDENLKKILTEMMTPNFPAVIEVFKSVFFSRKGRRWLEGADPKDVKRFLYDPQLGLYGETGLAEFINYYRNPAANPPEKVFQALFFSYLKLPEVLKAMRECVTDKDKTIQLASIIGLARMRDPIDEPLFRIALKDDDFEVVEEAMFALEGYEISREKTYKELAEVFQSEKTTPANIGALAVVLGREGKVRYNPRVGPKENNNMPMILAKINHNEVVIRRGVVMGLGYYHMNEQAAKAVVEKLLDTKQPMEVRIPSAVSLGQIQHKLAVDPLMAQLETDNMDFLCACIEALGSIGDMKAHDKVLAFLKHNDKKVQLSALKGLGMPDNMMRNATGVGEKGDVYQVLNFIKNDTHDLRWQAMWTAFGIAIKFRVAVLNEDGDTFLAKPPSPETLDEKRDAVYEMFLDWWETEKDAEGNVKKMEEKEAAKEKKEGQEEEKEPENEEEFDPSKDIGKQPVKVDELKPKKAE